jgi:phage gp36-like protein
MTYCVQADLESRFSNEELLQLTDRDGDGVVDADVLTAVIADVDAEINGYLGGRYALPLVTIPVVLTRIACDMVRYYLYDDAPHDQVRQRYEDGIKYLVSVSKGQVTLGLDNTDEPPVEEDGANIQSVGNAFARSASNGDW